MEQMLPEEFEDFRRFVIDPANEETLLDYLRTYSAGGGYTGAYFHELTFAGPTHPDRFDISDIASLSLLSVTLNSGMAKLLTTESEDTATLERNLSQEPDRDLASLSTDEVGGLERPDNGLNRAWMQIRKMDDIGPTRTSKLLARKRPRLMHIWDSVISQLLGLPSTKHYWRDFHTALTKCENQLDDRLGQLAVEAGVVHRYSRLRVLDILAWMHGTSSDGLETGVLTECDEVPGAE